MALIPPPRALTEKEFKDAGCKDVEFDKWLRYDSHHLGIFFLIYDKIFNKKPKNNFLGGHNESC